MQRTYEIMFIVRPDLADEDVDRLVATMETNITTAGGTITGTQRMGKRRMAYPVRKFNDGNYILFNVEGAGRGGEGGGTPPARGRAGDQVHHRSHRRGRQAAG